MESKNLVGTQCDLFALGTIVYGMKLIIKFYPIREAIVFISILHLCFSYQLIVHKVVYFMLVVVIKNLNLPAS